MPLHQGIVKVTVCYSSDALFLQEEFENFSYVSPSDGNVFWIDFWTISGKSHQADLALKFLDFMLRPEIVAQNVEYQYTATFSEKAQALLPEEIKQNKNIFPDRTDDLTTMGLPSRHSIRVMMKIINTLELN